jgi:hypothetical protein
MNYHLKLLFSIAEWYLRTRHTVKTLLCMHKKMYGWLLFDRRLGEKCPGAICKLLSMLVLHSCYVHLSEELKIKLDWENCNMVVIPVGITSQLQLLDVSFHKPFRDYWREDYNPRMLSEKLPLTKMVERSYKICCITNAVDGTEDILQDISEIQCPDLKSDLKESVYLECEIGCTNEEDSKLINIIQILSFVLICVCY